MADFQAPHLHIDEGNMYDSRLAGDYKIHDLAHSPTYGGDTRRSSKSAGSSRYDGSLMIENSTLVHTARTFVLT